MQMKELCRQNTPKTWLSNNVMAKTDLDSVESKDMDNCSSKESLT